MKRLPAPLSVPVAIAFAAVALSAVTGAKVALPGPLVSTQWLADNLSKVQVVEVRTDPRTTQRAAVLGLDDRGQRRIVEFGGHIPGAKIVPPEVLVAPRGEALVFREPDEYKGMLTTLGIDPAAPVITYCNSGNDAALAWFVFAEIMGNRGASAYEGSMHQWTAEKRPTVALVPPQK